MANFLSAHCRLHILIFHLLRPASFKDIGSVLILLNYLAHCIHVRSWDLVPFGFFIATCTKFEDSKTALSSVMAYFVACVL